MTIYDATSICGPCGNVLCSQYGCIKQSQRLAAQQFQPTTTPAPAFPSVKEYLSALDKVVELAGENAVLKHENRELKEKNENLEREIFRLQMNNASFKDGNNYE